MLDDVERENDSAGVFLAGGFDFAHAPQQRGSCRHEFYIFGDEWQAQASVYRIPDRVRIRRKPRFELELQVCPGGDLILVVLRGGALAAFAVRRLQRRHANSHRYERENAASFNNRTTGQATDGNQRKTTPVMN